MNSALSKTLSFCLILLLFSNLSLAADLQTVCQTKLQNAQKDIAAEIDSLEQKFFFYRMLETKIRFMTYENLWKARTQSMDPLNKGIRQSGHSEEDALLDELNELEQNSKNTANALHEGLRQFLHHETSFASCCPDLKAGNCFRQAIAPLDSKLKEGIDLFDHIYEHEREYRKAVDATVGGKQGLYPEETVEAEVKHGDYFWRFEMERRQIRFEEDSQMLRFIHELKLFMGRKFPGADCCTSCGEGDWNKNVEKIFEEQK
jgi:hypothetical protein